MFVPKDLDQRTEPVAWSSAWKLGSLENRAWLVTKIVLSPTARPFGGMVATVVCHRRLACLK